MTAGGFVDVVATLGVYTHQVTVGTTCDTEQLT